MNRLELLSLLKKIILTWEEEDMSSFAYALFHDYYEYIDSVDEVIKEKLENE